MINTVYRLVAPRLFEEVYCEIDDLENEVILRPLYLSICQADQRYYNGKRTPEKIKEKLPMALIHEGVAKVIKDNTETFNFGDIVVMIPNSPEESDEVIAENYLPSSKFCSSGFDGFTKDYVALKPDRLVKIPENINLKVASFTELVSVSVHAINRFINLSHKRKDVIGVWGDGNLGYITSLMLKTMFPQSKIIVFGVNCEKLSLFTFVDETYKINEVPEDLVIDHGFECVGTSNSAAAIAQIIDLINPEGTIAILGVCEYPIQIDTRMILEKGLRLFGTSRSGRSDFLDTIQLFKDNPKILSYLENIIAEICDINTLDDLNNAFEKDFNSTFGKTVLKWDK